MTTMSHMEPGAAAEWAAASNRAGRIVPDARPGGWARVAVRWHAAINYLLPIGYEDETGFHYGEMPVPAATACLGERAGENW